MADKMEGENAAWQYEHPTDHPDNKPPVTAVAESTEEDVKKYEDAVNAELAKGRPELDAVPRGGQREAAVPVDYEAKTVDELKELAKERGIEVAWDSRKADLVKALEKHDKAK